MKKMKLFALLATLLLLVAVVFTGCGGGDDDGGTTAPGTTAPGTTNPGTTDPGTTDPGTTVPTPTEYTITFSVNGTNTEVVVAAGELPAFTGSTDKAPDTAKRIAYEFAGWDKEIVAATENTTYTAKYNESLLFTPVFENEDFSATAFAGDLGIGGQIDKFNRINLAGKANVSWKTVGDTDKYLLLTLKPGSGDPVINIVQDQKGGLAAQMGNYKKVTFSFDLAKVADLATPSAEFRVRAGGDKPQILTITTEGVVNLIGNKGADVKPLTTLTETFKTVAITIDFATGTIEGYVDGAKIADSTFVSPKADETPAEFLARANVYLLDSWIAPNAAAATADQALCIDNIKVGVSYDVTFVVDGVEHKQSVIHGELPVFAGSTDKVSANPDHIAYKFNGWDKEIVAATEAATYTAKYEKVLLMNPVIKNEDFSETEVNADGANQKIVDFTAFNFTAKAGGSMKTVGDTDKYLKVLLTKDNPNDAVINLIEEANGGLAALMGDYKKVTFSFDLKKEAGTQLPVITEFCVRTRSGAEKFKFVTIDGEGNVKLFGGKLLTTLTETFKNIAVTIDFAAGTVDGYVDGVKIDSSEFTSPKAGETTAEYLSRMDIYILDCWIAQSNACTDKTLDVAFGIDDIKVVVDTTLENEDFSKTEVNAENAGVKINTPNSNAFNFTAKAGGSMKTVGDTDKYLKVLLTKDTPNDAVINLIEESKGGLAAAMSNFSNKKITISFDMKKEAGTQLPVITEFCVRTRPGSEKFKFVTIDGEGNVKLFGDKLLTTLTETFKTLSFTIDFEAGTVDGYVNGDKIESTTFTSPKAGETTAEYLSRMDIYILDCWIAQSSACTDKTLDVAFGIDDIKVVLGVSAK